MPLDIYVESPLSIYATNVQPKTKKPSLLHIQLAQIGTVSNPTTGVQVKTASNKISNSFSLGRGNHFSEMLISDWESGTMIRGSYIYGPADKTVTVEDEFKLGTPIGSANYFKDTYLGDAKTKAKRDASAYVVSTLTKSRDITGKRVARNADLTVWMALPQRKTPRPAPWTKTEKWEKKLLFSDNGGKIKSLSSVELIPIDPATQGGKKRAWLFMTGNFAQNIVAVKIKI